MGTAENPWIGNVFGASRPHVQHLKVAAGSSQTLTKGTICRLDTASGDVTPFAAITDNLLGAVVIPLEHQLAADPARMIPCIIPTQFDIFEFALDAGTAIGWGDELQWNAAGLKKSATDAIAQAVMVQPPQSGVTWPTISKVRCRFKLASLTAKGKELPFIGDDVGDAA